MTFGRQASGYRVLDGMLPSSIAAERSFLTSCGIATLRYAAIPPTLRAYLAAARGEDDGHRRPQRHERVPLGSPKGVPGDGAPARVVLKWRFKFRSLRWGNAKQTARLPAPPLRPQADRKRNVTPDAPRRRCWPTRAVEAGRDQSGQPGRIA